MIVASTSTWHPVKDPSRLCSTQVLASAEDFARGRCVALIENFGWGWIASALPLAADSAQGLIRSSLGDNVATAKAWCERTCRLHDRDPSAFTQPGFSPDLAKTTLSATEPSCQTGETVECRQTRDDCGHGDPSTLNGRIRAALDADPSQSDRAIARLAGCSPSTAGKVRAAMGLSTIERSVQRRGQTYAMRAPTAGAAS